MSSVRANKSKPANEGSATSKAATDFIVSVARRKDDYSKKRNKLFRMSPFVVAVRETEFRDGSSYWEVQVDGSWITETDYLVRLNKEDPIIVSDLRLSDIRKRTVDRLGKEVDFSQLSDDEKLIVTKSQKTWTSFRPSKDGSSFRLQGESPN